MPVRISSPFPWNKPREEAAMLLAENDLSDEAIAQRVGVSRRTLAGWKIHPVFAAQVGDHVGQIQVAMLRLAIAKKHKRLEVLDQMHDKLLTVIEERGVEYEDDAPGTRTGLVTKTFKMVGAGRDATMVTEWGVDTQTLREIRAIQEQAAKELGQWVEKREETLHLTFQRLADQMASELGLEPAELVAEADRIITQATRS